MKTLFARARGSELGAGLLSGLAGLPVLALCAVASLRCAGTAVQRQANVAHETARAFNTVLLPSLEHGYEYEQRHALDRECPGFCAADVAAAAVAPVRTTWAPIWLQVEEVRLDHETWRTELELCRKEADAGVCLPRLLALVHRFEGRLNGLRCTLRAAGKTSLDVLPGTPNCEVRDGG